MMRSSGKFAIIGFLFAIASSVAVMAQQLSKPETMFSQPGTHSARDLYKLAHETFTAGDLDGARLLCLRIFFDGHRSQNLLDLLGAIEIKADRPLLAGEWLRKALAMNPDDTVAKKILARFPPPPRPIPMEATKLSDHFAAISRKLPQLLARLTNPKLHFDAVLSEIERGQFYKALALSEEFEKRYPGLDGSALTALCAMYLGRTKDAIQLVETGLKKAPFHQLFLFVKAMISDTNPETSSSSKAKALFDLDQWPEAAKLADQFTQSNTRSAEGLCVKAQIAIETMKLTEAMAFLEEGAKRDPDNPVIDLLKAEILFLQKKGDTAGEQLRRAFRRGYNLPSVNLRGGLLAAASGKLEDARTILGEFENSLPLLDRDAYPYFVRLALEVGNLPLARKVLDEWKTRFPLKSALCYCEALYFIRAGDGGKSLEWTRKGFEANPDRLPFLQEIAANPIFEGDLELGMLIDGRLKKGGVTPGGAKDAVEPGTPPSAGTGIPAGKPADPPAVPAAAPVVVASGDRFKITISPEVKPEIAEGIKNGLNAALDKLEGFLGYKAATIQVQVVPTLNAGSRSVVFDLAADVLKISALYGDPGSLRGAFDQERNDLDPDREAAILQALPMQTLVEELVVALMAQRSKNLKTTQDKVLWMVIGLGQILGGDPEILRDRLVFTQTMAQSGQIKLLNPDEVNRILSDPSRSPGERLNAYTHAYLLAAFLLKKGSDLRDGTSKLLKVIDGLCQGKTLDKLLFEAFKFPGNQFESGWKDAAYWSLQQGIPYEW